MTANQPEVVFGADYIDDLTWHEDPSQRRRRMVVVRTYQRIAERLDLKYGASWVALRKAMQGVE